MVVSIFFKHKLKCVEDHVKFWHALKNQKKIATKLKIHIASGTNSCIYR